MVVEERGLLYPFGFPATLTTITERDPDISVGGEGTVAPGQVLALRQVRTLRIAQPVKTTADGSPFSRTFPFSAIEVTSSTFTGLGEPELGYFYTRETPELAGLTAASDELQQRSDDLEAQWRPDAGGLRTMEDLLAAGESTASERVSVAASLDSLNASLEEMNGILAQQATAYEAVRLASDALAEAQARYQQNPEGESADLSSYEDELRTAQANYSSAGTVNGDNYRLFTAQVKELAARLAVLDPQIAELCLAPRDEHDVARGGGPNAQAASDWIDLQPVLAQARAAVTELQGLASTPDVFVWPTTSAKTRLRFPVRLSRGDQIIDTAMPMIFIKDFVLPAAASLPEYASLRDPELTGKLDLAWAGPATDAQGQAVVSSTPASVVPAGGTLFDIVGAATPQPSDTHVLRSLNIVAGSLTDLFSPSLGRFRAPSEADRWSMLVELPQLQALRGPVADAAGAAADSIGVPNVDTSAVVSFAEDYLDRGHEATVLFKAVDGIGVDFTKAADRSGGLAAMQLAADGISRELGPVQLAGLTSGDPKQMIGAAATLLGFKLQDLVSRLPKPPTIVSDLIDGKTPVVRMAWKDVELGDVLAFRTTDATRLNLEVESSLDRVTTSCEVNDFSLVFPPVGAELLKLDFAAVRYHQVSARVGGAPVRIPDSPADLADLADLPLPSVGVLVAHPPKVTIEGFDITFLGPLVLLEGLRSAVDLIGSVPGVRPTAKGVAATFSLPIPDVICGAFNLSNMTFRSTVDVPFDGAPVSVTIAFASRESPFAVTVLAFGGGGYIEIYIDANGPRIEASIEFGAQLAVDFIVAAGEVHAFGGLRYLQSGNDVELSGYLRIGGSVEILKLVSVSIEIVISLSYASASNELWGRATLVLEIDLTLWSDSVEIDSGVWRLPGGAGPVSAGGAAPESLDANGFRRIGTGSQTPMADVDEAFVAVDAEVSDAELADWLAYRAVATGGANR